MIPVSAEVVPDVDATPERVLFGGRDVGTEVTEVISLRSLSARPFVVERMEAEGAGVSATTGTDGRSCTVRVKVTAPGPLTGQVRLWVQIGRAHV